MALGLVLVVGAGLVVQSFRALAAAHPGFDPRDTLTMRVSTPPGPQFNRARPSRRITTTSLRRLAALPGVAAVGAISQLPLTGQGPLQPYAYDAETARNWEQLSADSFNVTPGYFAAVRATMLAGRDITRTRCASGRRVIVIDDSLARARVRRRADNAVGRLLQLEPEAQPESFFEVVGVVAHMRYHDLRRAQLPQIYRGGAVPDVQRRDARGRRRRRAGRRRARRRLRSSGRARPSRTCVCSPTSSTMRSGRCGWRCG